MIILITFPLNLRISIDPYCFVLKLKTFFVSILFKILKNNLFKETFGLLEGTVSQWIKQSSHDILRNWYLWTTLKQFFFFFFLSFLLFHGVFSLSYSLQFCKKISVKKIQLIYIIVCMRNVLSFQWRKGKKTLPFFPNSWKPFFFWPQIYWIKYCIDLYICDFS